MERMQCEKPGDESAALECPGVSKQHPEQQDPVQAMDCYAGDVMRAGINSKQFAIEHMGQPGQWMPVSHEPGRKGPLDPLNRKPAMHDFVLHHVIRIVEVRELKCADTAIGGKGQCNQSDTPWRHATPLPSSPAANLSGPTPHFAVSVGALADRLDEDRQGLHDMGTDGEPIHSNCHLGILWAVRLDTIASNGLR